MKQYYVSFFFMSSCSEETKITDNNYAMSAENHTISSYQITSEDFQFFGDIHNAGLDYIYFNLIM